MTRWLIPITVTALVALALLAFPDEVGAVDNDDAAPTHEVGCGGVLDVSVAAPDVYRTDFPSDSDSVVNARVEQPAPALPTVTLIADEAPESGVPWTWLGLLGAVGLVAVAGVVYAVRPALAR